MGNTKSTQVNNEKETINNYQVDYVRENQHFNISAASLVIMIMIIVVVTAIILVKKCIQYVKNVARKELQEVVIAANTPRPSKQ